MTERLEHGTPEGYDAGCTVDVECPAFAIHGMSCETARIRYVSGETRYLRLRALGRTSTQIAHELGFTAATSAQRALAETRPEYQAAMRRRIAETQRLAGAPTTSTPTSDPTRKETAMPSPADVAKTSKPLTVQPVPEIPDPVVDALAEEPPAPTVVDEPIAEPAVPKTPRQKPVTKPAAKRPTKPATAATAAPAPSVVRAWARENGIDVNAKGSVRSDVMAAYLDAHNGKAPAQPETDEDRAVRIARETIAEVAAAEDLAHQPVDPAEFDEAMAKARDRAELEQLNRDADGEPDLPVAVGQQLVDENDDVAEVLHLPDPELVVALEGTVTDTEMAAACVDPDGTARIELIRRIEDGWTNVTRGGEYFPSVRVAATFDDVVVTYLPEPVAMPAPEGRPEWADVTIPEDIEKARAIAVRLEQELAHVEEQLASAYNAVDVTLAKWDTDTSALKAENQKLAVQLAVAQQTASIWAGLYRTAEEDLMRRRLDDEKKLAEGIAESFLRHFHESEITVMPAPRRARRTFWKRAN